LGNPPFIGQSFQTAEQKQEQHFVLSNIQACGVLDYVCNWYVKAADFIQGTRIVVAFVSTNSITQGEQVGILWTELFSRYHLKIYFGHRTFAWESEARGKAHVHVVVIGFAAFDAGTKRIYDYEAGGEHATTNIVKNISPYLVEGADHAISNRADPLCSVPKMSWGNKPTDGGHFLLSPEQRDQLLEEEPGALKFIRPYMGGHDFINDEKRYCLWLADADPNELRKLPRVMARVELVRVFRAASKAESTRKYAQFPTIFRQVAQPDSNYLAVPEVSSERRPYIPVAFVPREVICSNTVQFVPDAGLFHFGVVTSVMHMAWVRQICGRLESRYRYSNSLVYNNYPWPQSLTAKQKETVELAAQKVLDVRAHFPGATLADLYDPLSMPPALVKAHADLDRAADLCYRPQPFTSERQRVEYLFGLYEQLTAPLLPPAGPKRPRRRVTS